VAADVQTSTLDARSYEVWVYDPALGKDGWSKSGPFDTDEKAIDYARDERRNGHVAIVEHWGALESRSSKSAREIVKTASDEIERATAAALFAARKNGDLGADNVTQTSQKPVTQSSQRTVTSASQKPGNRPSVLTRNDRFVSPRKDSPAPASTPPKFATATPRTLTPIRRMAPLVRPTPAPRAPETAPAADAPDADDLPI
jgi:hypothetical protein